ncbi:MAG: YgiT-type zinc finger protein [Chthonomonadaceae bacterium]|nr:YgiT-type zinc finger protein [Chthonomonadaceae bacterium]
MIESNSAASRAAVANCQVCGGSCERHLITLTLRKSQIGFAVVRNVPAEVCQNCGESVFTLATTGQLMSAIHSDRTPDEVALIPIYDFAPAS